jgi:hypothetical protein
MKSRRVVALALVGWYLMLPHFMYLADGSMSGPTAPLPQWDLYGSYDSAAECETARSFAITKASDHGDYAKLREELEAAQCIATNDPRLAK